MVPQEIELPCAVLAKRLVVVYDGREAFFKSVSYKTAVGESGPDIFRTQRQTTVLSDEHVIGHSMCEPLCRSIGR